MPEDLAAAKQLAVVCMEPGDMLFVRTGNYRKSREQGRARR